MKESTLGRCGRSRCTALFLPVAALLMLAQSAGAQPNTTSQATSNQLNQLFGFETTPNKSAMNEWYVSGEFRFLDFEHGVKTYLYQLQGQYSFTEQLAVGGILPFQDASFSGGSNEGMGNTIFYAQYKLDQLVNHDIVDLTAQGDFVIPGSSDTGASDHFGVRPWILAYKGFEVGGGEIGAYGALGFTLTTNPDFRMNLAGTYDWEKIVGVLEFTDIAGDKIGAPQVAITPGIVYHGINPWEFGLGLPFGLNNASPNWGIVLKVTFAFQR
jgi:hypothetical protein